MRTTDAAFEHATTPDWNIVGLSDVMNTPGFQVTAYPANFDINDTTGPNFERFASVLRRKDRFIQTNRGF